MALTMFANQQITAKIDAFARAWPGAAFGPAHVILSDYNFSKESFDWCLDLTRSALEKKEPLYPGYIPFARTEDRDFLESVNWYASCSKMELLATRKFLQHLKGCIHGDEEESQ